MYGINVNAQRIGFLGKRVLNFALWGKVPSKVYVEVGPGKSRLAAILAALSFECHLYDIDPSLGHFYAHLSSCLNEFGKIIFHNLDVRKMGYADVPRGIGILVSDRTLHHLRFSETLRLLKILVNRTSLGGRIFLSFSGMNSPLSEGYPHIHRPIEYRYAHLRPDVAEKFKIRGEVCLYSLEDARELIERVGKLRILEIKETDFGNVFVSCERVSS